MRSVGYSGDRFLISTNEGVFTSTDTGTTWTRSELGLTGKAREIWTFQRVGNRLLAGTSAGVYASDDNGASWRLLGNGLAHIPVRSLVADSTYLFAGTFGAGIWRIPLDEIGFNDRIPQAPRMISPTAGSHIVDTTVTLIWQSLPQTDRYHLQVARDMEFMSGIIFDGPVNDTARIIAGLERGGTYYWHVRDERSDSNWSQTFCFHTSSPSSSVTGGRHEYPGVELDCSPNPSTGNATVEFMVPHRSPVHLTLNDISGKEVAVVLSEVLDAGRYAIALRYPDLPTGVYLLRLATSKSSLERQVIILH